MVLEQWWNDDRLNPENSGKTSCHCPFVHYIHGIPGGLAWD